MRRNSVVMSVNLNPLSTPKAIRPYRWLSYYRVLLLSLLALYIFSNLPGSPSVAASDAAQTYPAGALDPTFGAAGKSLITFGSLSSNSVKALALQPDGKLIIGGTTNAGAVANDSGVGDFALLRLNADGSIDQTFGTGGRVVTNISDGDSLFAVALQADGKI